MKRMNKKKQCFEKIAELTHGEVLVLFTNTDFRVPANIEHSMLSTISKHLINISKKYESRKIPQISLVLNTNGGNLPSARAIVKIIRQFSEKLMVIVPERAMSAGTMITIGADEIVMTQQATLGPLDPSISSMKTAIGEVPFSAQDMIKSLDNELLTSEEKKERLLTLLTKAQPIVLGQALRAQEQIGDMVTEFLQDKLPPEKFLSTKKLLMGYTTRHDYPFVRDDAISKLQLPVRETNSELERSVLELFSCYESDFQAPSNEEIACNKGTLKTNVLVSVIASESRGQDVQKIHLEFSDDRLKKQFISSHYDKFAD